MLVPKYDRGLHIEVSPSTVRPLGPGGAETDFAIETLRQYNHYRLQLHHASMCLAISRVVEKPTTSGTILTCPPQEVTSLAPTTVSIA